jgi:glycosyltransferase involved in cell wall biosynthesis
VEAVKNALNTRTFRLARHLIAWSEWTKHSLICDYGVKADKISVIPPGIDMDEWHFPARAREKGGPVRLLFVGGDFLRKGGATLLQAFRQELMGTCELDIVTREQVDLEGLRGVRVHHSLKPNGRGLKDLYAAADVFVFPTLGDVRPLAVMEAMASGLPVVSTHVGAIGEQVDEGVTGFLVPPGDDQAVAEAVLRLVADPGLRCAMGVAGRTMAERLFNAEQNYRDVLTVCKTCVDGA